MEQAAAILAYGVNEPKKLKEVMDKIAPLPGKGARRRVGEIVDEDPVEGAGEFVRNWWPKGGLGASDGEQG